MRAFAGPAVFSYGFRPFFFFGAVWGALAPPLWVLVYLGLVPLPGVDLDWHVHEMIFGYLAAVIAGFLLTAVPNWTGRLPVVGAPLAGLFVLWLAGRVAMLLAGWLGPAAAVIDAVFLVALAAVVWREIGASRLMRNVPVAVMVSLLALANIAFHLRAVWPEAFEFAEHGALGAVAFLVSLIGGRITPSFTRNWLARMRAARLPHGPDRLDLAALVVIGAALALWIVVPHAPVAGPFLIAAGLAVLFRLSRWCGLATWGEPLVAILHVGYFWLGAAFLLLGLAELAGDLVPHSAGEHALTAGAFGVMTLAVMTRATRGHTGRPLAADGATVAIYVLVNLAALARVAAPFTVEAYPTLLMTAALGWIGAFGLFAAAYGPMLLTRRPAQPQAR